jgi:hypothetical protein
VGADLLVVEVVAVVVVLWEEDFGWRGVVNIVVGCCEGRAGMEALSCVVLNGAVTVRGKHFPYTASGRQQKRPLHFTEICSITPPSLVC